MSDLIKYITFDALNKYGEPSVQPIYKGGHMEKVATDVHPLIKEAAAGLPDRDDGIWVLVNALGAMEYWGSNSNGDAFPEESLKYACPAGECPREQDYGHKTFEKYAYPYRHHVNKDPAKSIGERVKIAVWNDDMKRVELIHFLRSSDVYDDFGDVIKVGAADLISRIEDGEETHVSMGCKVPYDVCSICNNKSKNTSLYCDHLKLAMNQVMPDGRTVCAINTIPRFFDISYVLKGAEKTARVLKKLAASKDELRQSSNRTFHFIADGIEKAASEKRQYTLPSAFYADIIKVAQDAEPTKNVPGGMKKKVTSNVGSDDADKKVSPRIDKAVKVLRQTETAFPESLLKSMAGYSFPEIASTTAGLGMKLHPGEIRRVVMIKIRNGKGRDELESPFLSPDCYRPSLASLLKEQMVERSALREPLRQRTLKLLSTPKEELKAKVAANNELTEAPLGDLARQTMGATRLQNAPVAAFGQQPDLAKVRPSFSSRLLNAAVPVAAVGAAIHYAMMNKTASAELEPLFEMASSNGAHGLDWTEVFSDMEKAASKAKAGLIAGTLAVPYLASGYVQQKAQMGQPITEREAWVARNPGVLALGSTVAGLAAAGKVGRMLKKTASEKPSGQEGHIPISDVLSYASDPEIVDNAIIEGLNEVAGLLGY